MKNTKKTSNNVSYPLRVIAGIYLLYLAYSLVKGWQENDNKVFFAIFIAIFSIIGILLLINSAMGLLRNRNSQNLNQDDQEAGESVQDTEDIDQKAGESIQNTEDIELEADSTENAYESEPKEADKDGKADN